MFAHRTASLWAHSDSGGVGEQGLEGHSGKCQLVCIRQIDVGNTVCGGAIGKMKKVCLKTNCGVDKHVELKGVNFEGVAENLYLIKSHCGT